MENIENENIELTTIDGFTKKFWDYFIHFRTQVEAYEALEEFYSGIFGKRKYSNFESFRQVRDRDVRENNKQKSEQKIIKRKYNKQPKKI